uniref:Uncharacterized protein n=1 Tax=Knipowitschia caucasica TaxID=637954 RepID=A0AAV2K1E5_KNICA
MCALPQPQAQHAAEENQPSEHISNLTRTAMPQGSMDPNTSDQLPLAEQTSQLQTPPDPLRTRIIYTREELLALRSSGLTSDLHVPTELIQGRRRRRGCRGGKKRKLWAQQRQAKGSVGLSRRLPQSRTIDTCGLDLS